MRRTYKQTEDGSEQDGAKEMSFLHLALNFTTGFSQITSRLYSYTRVHYLATVHNIKPSGYRREVFKNEASFFGLRGGGGESGCKNVHLPVAFSVYI